jgi:hypothetical protein
MDQESQVKINSLLSCEHGNSCLASKYCFPVAWESVGDVILVDGVIRNFAVDTDFNIYFPNTFSNSLEKWSFSGQLIRRYFEGSFYMSNVLFFHLPSQSLYFCYTWEGDTGVYKLGINQSKPVNVLNNTMPGIGQYRIEYGYDGLYVNSIGDIFVLFRTGNVIKWPVNNPTGVLVADGYKSYSTTGRPGSMSALAVDEIGTILYLLDEIGPRVFKYSNGSTIGTVITDLTTKQEIFSDVAPIHEYSRDLIADRTGNIILATTEKVSLLTPDGKFNVTLLFEYRMPGDHSISRLSVDRMVFDRLGNLYVLDMSRALVKFNRTTPTCTNVIS